MNKKKVIIFSILFLIIIIVVVVFSVSKNNQKNQSKTGEIRKCRNYSDVLSIEEMSAWDLDSNFSLKIGAMNYITCLAKYDNIKKQYDDINNFINTYLKSFDEKSILNIYDIYERNSYYSDKNFDNKLGIFHEYYIKVAFEPLNDLCDGEALKEKFRRNIDTSDPDFLEKIERSNKICKSIDYYEKNGFDLSFYLDKIYNYNWSNDYEERIQDLKARLAIAYRFGGRAYGEKFCEAISTSIISITEECYASLNSFDEFKKCERYGLGGDSLCDQPDECAGISNDLSKLFFDNCS